MVLNTTCGTLGGNLHREETHDHTETHIRGPRAYRGAVRRGVILGMTTPAWTGWDEAVAAYQRGDYATAIRKFRPLAEQGDAGAQYNLGLMYRNGQGVPQDDAEAMKWYREAAEQGDARAQNNLGVMYGEGKGVPQDYAKAMKWYRKAAEQGHADAKCNLGAMYAEGLGVPQDDAQAHMWFNLAASRYPPGEDRDRVVKNRDIIAKMMTPAQIAEAEKLAREWRPKV